MYNVPYFKTPDEQEVLAFMQAHPFIMLCGCDVDGRPVVTNVPVLIETREDKIFLRAHVMRKQDHTRAFEKNNNVLAVFYGEHTYVSASWYTNQKVAGTWNYQSVHARGILRFLDDQGLLTLLTRLTEKFEHVHSPSLVQNMDENYVRSMMKAIVAFEIEITDIQHVFKLSQNRDEKSYENIILHLQQQGDNAKTLATVMKERKGKVFPS